MSRTELKCRQFMRKLASAGYSDKITVEQLKDQLRVHIGISYNTTESYFKALQTLGFVTKPMFGVFEIKWPLELKDYAKNKAKHINSKTKEVN